MEDYKKNNDLITAHCEQQVIDKDIGCWSNNSFECNFQIKKDSKTVINMDSYNSYECEVNNRQLESQNIFNMEHNGRNTTELEENNDCVNLMDSEVNGVYEMGRDFLELNQDIHQKQNDIKLLQDNSKSLKKELKEKRKVFEKLKLDLLTEQDNYDDFQKKLDDEVEIIAAVGLQQEALSNLTKNLSEQQFRVDKLLENFSIEFSSAKIDGEKLLYMIEENCNLLKTVIQAYANKEEEVNKNRTVFLEEKMHIEEILKIKLNEMEHRHEYLKIKYYKKIAILDYLKFKGTEEWSKCAEFESELKSIEQNGHKQINIEDNSYIAMNEREKNIIGEVQDLKQKISSEKMFQEELEHKKKELEDQIESLLKKEAMYLLEVEILNKSLSDTAMETTRLNETLSSKIPVKEKNYEIHKCYETLVKRRNYIAEEDNEIENLIIKTESKFEDLELKLQEGFKEQQMVKENTNFLDSKRMKLMKDIEELKEESIKHINNLENQISERISERETLQHQMTQYKYEIESQIQISDNQSCEILKTKELLQENCERVDLLHIEIEKINNVINSKHNQFEIDMSSLKNNICDKEKSKADVEAKIKYRIELQSEIEHLISELHVIDCQQKDELKKLKEKYSTELQEKQEYIENRKNKLESLCKDKKKNVSDLQEDIVDEQKNELHLVKEIQKLAYVHDKNKRELLTLKNVIKTLDEKLNTIAQAVTNSLKDKESVIQSQSSMLSIRMAPPNTDKSTAKRKPCDYDSSSSGISMHDNDTTWKKKLLKKQQLKQQYVQSQPSTSTQLITSDKKLNVESSAIMEFEKKENPKRKPSKPENKPSDKPTPKKKTVKPKPKTPTKKAKK